MALPRATATTECSRLLLAAQELDVYVEWLDTASADGAQAGGTPAPRAVPTEDEKKVAAAVAAYASRLEAGGSESAAEAGPGSSSTSGPAEERAADRSRQNSKEEEGGGSDGDAGSGAGGCPPASGRSSPEPLGFRQLDAFARQRHDTLWASRTSADKWFAKRLAEKASKKKQFTLVPSTTHEVHLPLPLSSKSSRVSATVLRTALAYMHELWRSD